MRYGKYAKKQNFLFSAYAESERLKWKPGRLRSVKTFFSGEDQAWCSADFPFFMREPVLRAIAPRREIFFELSMCYAKNQKLSTRVERLRCAKSEGGMKGIVGTFARSRREHDWKSSKQLRNIGGNDFRMRGFLQGEGGALGRLFYLKGMFSLKALRSLIWQKQTFLLRLRVWFVLFLWCNVSRDLRSGVCFLCAVGAGVNCRMCVSMT